MTNKHDIRFTYKIDRRDEYETFKAHVVYMVEPEPSSFNPNDAGVRNPSPWPGRDALAPLADLVVTAQRTTDSDWYAWRLCYERPYQVELDDAERMVKFLRSASRKLAKLDEKYGQPESLAAFCGRVADVIGVTSPQAWGQYRSEIRPNGTHYNFHDVDWLRSTLARARADA